MAVNNLFMLVYTSRATKPVTPELLQNILNDSVELNKRDNISGFLVERRGYFLQLLEGPEQEVRACYHRILNDDRHGNIVLQGEAFASERLMPDWGMGFVEAGGEADFPRQVLELFELGRAGNAYRDPESLNAMLWMFMKDARVKTIGSTS